jgi:hypothetical protein
LIARVLRREALEDHGTEICWLKNAIHPRVELRDPSRHSDVWRHPESRLGYAFAVLLVRPVRNCLYHLVVTSCLDDAMARVVLFERPVFNPWFAHHSRKLSMSRNLDQGAGRRRKAGGWLSARAIYQTSVTSRSLRCDWKASVHLI